MLKKPSLRIRFELFNLEMLTSRLPNYSQESLLDSRTEPACSAVKERTCIPSFISKTFEILEVCLEISI